MDRREAMFRELNLYPQWVRRGQPAPAAEQPVPVAEITAGAMHELPEQRDAEIPVGAIDGTTDEATSHLTNPAKNAGQVIGYSHSTRPSKDDAQVAGYHELPEQSDAMPAERAIDESPLQWPELKETVRDCTICKLRAGCTQTVFGVGDEKADWLFVGEGPGADEDARGEPFVGEAGKLLDNMLLAIKLKRGSNVYIANVIKCHPPGNRPPEADEIAACLPYLRRQIELVQPKLIVALGKVASNALLGKDATLASLRGTPHDYHGIPLVVTYHPAYLLRSPSEKAKAWQDLCLAVSAMAG